MPMTTGPVLSLQEIYFSKGTCFGCGPANAKGLRLKSYEAVLTGEEEGLVARWKGEPHHAAFPGMLCGGIIGSLLDCHSNWTAAWHLMKKRGADHPPCTVTAEYAVQLKRPTPLEVFVTLRSRVEESGDDRVTVSATLEVESKVSATCRGIFVAVRKGHPAFHRW